MAPPTDRFVAETPLRVRYAEVDAQRIVHHSAYIVYFEEGRSDYARQRGQPYGEIERGGLALLVVDVAVRYHKPASYEDLLTVRTWLAEIQSRRMVFHYEIVHSAAQQIVATGSTTHICVSREGQIRRIPNDWSLW